MSRDTSPTFRRKLLALRLTRMRMSAGLTLDEAARRRRIADEDFPLELVAIIDEAALRKRVGGTEVMRGQLQHLVRCADLPAATVQVIPDSVGSHDGLDGAFTLLRFANDELECPDMLYVEYPSGSIHIEKAEDVAEARLVFEHLRSVALEPEDSAEFIERIAANL